MAHAGGGGTGRGRGLGRVVIYYAVLGAAVVALIRYAPAWAELFLSGRLDALAEGEALGPAGPLGPLPEGPGATPVVYGTLSMLGALAVMVPVTWVYMITRRHRGYHESVVHTLLILPVAVTGIVIIVQNSIALAFSLAGIVAAVRFRTTLEDTKDAVYVFLAIGVGLASGVQALGLALAMSVVFNLLILVLWATRFGNIYADQNTRTGPLALGDVLAGPGSAAAARLVGDPALLDAAAPADLGAMLERAARIEPHLAQERRKKKDRRANALILVGAAEAGAAQRALEAALEETATRHKLVDAEVRPDGGVLLTFLARFDDEAGQGDFLDRAAQVEGLGVVEVRSLKGLKKRG